MYCPECGKQNIPTAQFCRTCGVNLSLVPKAISGELAERNRPASRRGKARRPPSIDAGIKKLFSGLAFVIIAMILLRLGEEWGLWLLIPGFIGLGTGLGQILGARQEQLPSSSGRELPAPPLNRELQPPRDLNRVGHPSVTEGTTRSLGNKPPDSI